MAVSSEQEVIQLVKEYFKVKGHTILNLSNLVKLNDPRPGMGLEYHTAKSIAATLREYGEYEIETEGSFDATIYFVRPIAKKHWTVRHPFIFSLATIILAAIGSWLVQIATTTAQDQRDTRQEKHLDSLSGELKILQKQLADSTARLRADTTLKNK